MFLLSLFASAAPLGPAVLGQPYQGTPLRESHARLARPSSLAAFVFDGFVLAPDGVPAEGAMVVSNAGGKAVTGRDGRYRLEVQVPADVESIQLTAVASDGLLASLRIGLHATRGLTPVDPLLLVPATECEPRWLPTFGGDPGAGDSIRALAVFDDGSGPALYVGGDFTRIGTLETRHVARWDGSTWSALSLGLGLSGPVHALAVFDDGSGPALYVAGSFTMRGNNVANRIAKWNGIWTELGDGLNNEVHALAVFDDGSGAALYVGGSFTTAGGASASRIARWDGASWSAVAGGVNGPVNALTVFDDGGGAVLHAGGSFTSADGAPANRIARWDGTSWSTLGTGMDGSVAALAVFDDGSGPALHAGGSFTSAGGGAANHIAKWDGASWSALAGGMNGSVNAMAVFDDGGGPVLVSGSNGGPQHIARWNGASWSPMQGGMNASVLALLAFDDGGGPALHAGGTFTTAGNAWMPRAAKWDGLGWSAMATASGLGPGLNGSVGALAAFDDGSGPALYAGGDFTSTGSVEASRIARWDGTSWAALGSGVSNAPFATDPRVQALEVFDDGSGPALYAGGVFVSAGGVAASRIARWDGTSWSALGSGMDSSVEDLEVFDDGSGPALYAGGTFSSAGGVPASCIARWDGASWSSLGSGTLGRVSALAVFDDGSGPALFAGGRFGFAGSVAAKRIARWDGSSWSALGSGMEGAATPDVPEVLALTVFDDGGGPALYAGGEFERAGGVVVNGIARWDGASWSAVGGGLTLTDYSFVSALAVFDDGTGPTLYAGGSFDDVKKWDGATWSNLGSGTSPGSISALATFDPGHGPALFAGGSFTVVQDSEDSFLGRWGRPTPCVVRSKVRPR